MPFTKFGSEIFRDYEVDGVPSSGAHKPIKQDVRDWTGVVETFTPITGTFLTTITLQGNALMLLQGAGAVNVTNGAQNVIQFQGQGDLLTTSIHLNPGPGALPTGTVTEFVSEGTNTQAFGGNYRRWSFSSLGASLSNRTGLIGETGGTGPVADFIIQTADENPPGTFTVQNFLFLRATPTASEAAQLGAVGVGNGDIAPSNKLVLNMANIGSPGTRDSSAFLWEGKANDGTERALWWRAKVSAKSQAGASSFQIQRNLNGAGWTTVLDMPDAGPFTPQLTPAATIANTTETTLQTLTLPANALDNIGRGLKIRAWGTYGATANTKRIRLYFGAATVIGDSTALAQNGTGWVFEGEVYKTGSSTQTAWANIIAGNAIPGANQSQPNQTDTSAIVVKVTGLNGTAAANDIVCNGMAITYLN